MASVSERPAASPSERLFAALTDPSRRERAMAFLLAGYAAAWTLYGVIAKSSQDIHADMGEMLAWANPLVLGTAKHPPLGAWIAAAWFSIFPHADWAFYLLAVLLPTLALWIAWRLAEPYLAPEKRVIGILLLTLVPFYNFHALKFNANSVLLPCWAATTWCFLKSLDTRSPKWSVLAGAASAAALLGKYWSLVLLAGLGLAALTDARRKEYFRSLSPWLTILTGTILIAPHVVWLFTHSFAPFGYALGAHPASLFAAFGNAASFVVGVAAYVSVPLLWVLIAARPSGAAIIDIIWPSDPMRRTIVIAFAAPILIAVLVSVALEVLSSAIWMMPAMTLLPVVLMSSPLVVFSRQAAVRLLTLAFLFPLVMIAAAPGIAFVIHHAGVKNDGSHYKLIAGSIQHIWTSRTQAPLRIVGGDPNMIDPVAFYLHDLPQTLNVFDSASTPWIDDGRIKREGLVIVCRDEDATCVKGLTEYAARYGAGDAGRVELARRFFGAFDQPVTYRILLIPPR